MPVTKSTAASQVTGLSWSGSVGIREGLAEVLAAQVFREIVGRGAWGGPHALASQLGEDGLHLQGTSCKTPWRAASGWSNCQYLWIKIFKQLRLELPGRAFR